MAAAKKTTAKKTAVKKTAAKKATPARESGDQAKQIAESVASAIKEGDFDGHLQMIDEALTNRMQQPNRSNGQPAKKATEKKVAPPPKRSAKKINLKNGTTYQIVKGMKGIGGAKVKFIRYKADSDEKKSVVEMVTSKPGYPKGKKVAVQTMALEEVEAKKNRK